MESPPLIRGRTPRHGQWNGGGESRTSDGTTGREKAPELPVAQSTPEPRAGREGARRSEWWRKERWGRREEGEGDARIGEGDVSGEREEITTGRAR